MLRMVTKKYLSADDFLLAITLGGDDVEVPGFGTIRIRALSLHEVDDVRRKATVKGGEADAGKLMAYALYYGVVEPKLSEDAVDSLMAGSAGVLTKVARRIMALSGLGADEELAPLAGGGS
jgi:hypothetical protein